MQKPKYIKSFLFDVARYRLSDGAGDEVLLHVNYYGNSFYIEDKGKTVNDNFRNEVGEVAKSLLARKHGVNFAKK